MPPKPMSPQQAGAIRKELGRSQEELAHLIGVHPMTVSKWERGAVPIPLPAAALLRLLLQVKRGELVPAKGSKGKPEA